MAYDFDCQVKLNDVEWNCYSLKTIKKIHQNQPFHVIGEVSSRRKGKTSSIVLDGKELVYSLIGTYSSLGYRTYAYIPVSEDTYIAVKKSNMLWIIIILLSCALMFGLGARLLLPDSFLDPNASDYTSTLQRPKDWDGGSILLPGFDDLRLEADSDVLHTAFYNPKGNPCYFQYKLIYKDTGEILYQSGLIAPGKAVTEEKLNRSFSKGIYKVSIKIDTFSLKNHEDPLNGGAIETELVAIEQ